MNWLSYFTAQLTVELTGADIPGTLRMLSERGITLLKTIPMDDLTVRINIGRKDYPRIREIAEKRGDTLVVRNRIGLYWKFRELLNRPVLILGLCLLLILSAYLPTRIFFVQVEGNVVIPTRLILEKAGACGIGFGASRRAVRSERMKNTLLEAVPQLQWAGVNTRGCVAVISVRERAEEQETAEPSAFGHIVALMDGYILSCTATKGNLICGPGQAVVEGQILISGYTDTGLCIRAEQAQGEIYGRTIRSLELITPSGTVKKTDKDAEGRKISLLIGKKRINLWKDSGIWDTTCDRMYEEYYITLPGGFQLPMALTVERYVSRELSDAEIPQVEAEQLLESTAKRYLKDQMLAGSIQDSQPEFTAEPGIVQMAGKFDCVELIGVMQRLQIGETNGENN